MARNPDLSLFDAKITAKAWALYKNLVDEEHKIARVLSRHRKKFAQDKNIIACGVARKTIRGTVSSELCAAFYVREKLPASKIRKSRKLPISLRVDRRSIRTDVVEIGTPRLLAGPHFPPLPPPPPWFLILPYGNSFRNNLRYRPVEMGTSIAIYRTQQQQSLGFGTAGALVQDQSDKNQFIMSAKHVLMAIGNDVVEPKSGQNRTPPPNPRLNDYIGGVARLGQVTDSGLIEAVASVPQIVSIGHPNPPVDPIVSLRVQKSGATTGLTFSEVVASNVLVLNVPGTGLRPWIPGQSYFFVDNSCPAYAPLPPIDFAQSGDSGSLIVAGWPLDTLDFGARVNAILQAVAMASPLVAFALRLLISRAALGLLLGSAGGPGAQVRIVGYPNGLIFSERIALALNDLNVDLV